MVYEHAGMQPLLYSEKAGHGWTRVGYNISYSKNSNPSLVARNDRELFTLSWTMVGVVYSNTQSFIFDEYPIICRNFHTLKISVTWLTASHTLSLSFFNTLTNFSSLRLLLYACSANSFVKRLQEICVLCLL